MQILCFFDADTNGTNEANNNRKKQKLEMTKLTYGLAGCFDFLDTVRIGGIKRLYSLKTFDIRKFDNRNK